MCGKSKKGGYKFFSSTSWLFRSVGKNLCPHLAYNTEKFMIFQSLIRISVCLNGKLKLLDGSWCVFSAFSPNSSNQMKEGKFMALSDGRATAAFGHIYNNNAENCFPPLYVFFFVIQFICWWNVRFPCVVFPHSTTNDYYHNWINSADPQLNYRSPQMPASQFVLPAKMYSTFILNDFTSHLSNNIFGAKKRKML